MFYYLSKFAWFVATPSNLLVGLILLGIGLAFLPRTKRTGLRLALVAALATLALGLLPVANYILLPLESRFPAFQDDGNGVDVIVLLGGSVDASESVSRGTLMVNEAAERVLDTIALARRYPEARILISGGGGTVFGDGTAEAPVIAEYLKRIGIDPARLIVEDRSRTTHENALFSREVLVPQPGERWLLVTSAWHMPRAMGVFRKAGFPVTAYPVDFRTWKGIGDQRPFAFVSDGLRRLDISTKEWVGLVAYSLSGRTSALLPSP